MQSAPGNAAAGNEQIFLGTEQLEQYDSGAAGRAVRTCDVTRAGTLLCSSQSLAIALEPHRRSTRCGFCTAALATKQEGCCKACGLIAICASCRSAGAVQLHEVECAKLAELSGGNPDELSSLVLLCARIVLRGSRAVADTKSLCTNELAMGATEAGRESLVQLRAAGHGLSGMLAPAPPTPRAPLQAVAAAAAAAAAAGAVEASAAPRVLLVCCANSHNLTDLTLPLGEQSMGVGLFPRLSLFNHACAARVPYGPQQPLPAASSPHLPHHFHLQPHPCASRSLAPLALPPHAARFAHRPSSGVRPPPHSPPSPPRLRSPARCAPSSR